MTSRLRTLLGCAALLLASAFTAGVASAQTTQVQLTMPGCATLSGPQISGSTITLTCNAGVGNPNAPKCTVPTYQTVGTTQLTLSATCTQGTNAITSVTAFGVAQVPQNPTGTYTVTVPIPTAPPGTTFSITASDGTNSGSNSVFYSVSGGGGGAVDLSACAALGYPNSAYYDSAYPSGANINVYGVFHEAVPSGMPFGNGSALVVRFTTPATGQTDSKNVNFQAFATGSNNNHQATIGTAPCLVPQTNSATPADASSPSLPVIKTVFSQTPSLTVQITANGLCDPALGSCASSGKVWLRPSTTYYVTLVNKSAQWNGFPNCTTGDCDMRFNFNN